MSDKTIKALKIIRDHGPIRPREFAKKMWPDSPRWRCPAKCGNNGSHVGGGMYLAGGGYLGRLTKKGLVEQKIGRYLGKLDFLGYQITEHGMHYLLASKPSI